MDIMLVLILYMVFASCILLAIFGGFLWGAMWMRLPERHVKRMLKLADLDKAKVAYDLGAGFGNVAFKAAASAGYVVAVEADPFKAWWLKRKARRISNVLAVKSNLLDVDLEKADVLLCYLSDRLMAQISKKTLKQGCLIVSACHKIAGWTPKLIDRDGIYPIYVYSPVDC